MAGDKPSSFVGSKQWIGAIELGYILDTLLGASSKVITVSTGAEMPSKAREIAHHFDTQVCTRTHYILPVVRRLRVGFVPAWLRFRVINPLYRCCKAPSQSETARPQGSGLR